MQSGTDETTTSDESDTHSTTEEFRQRAQSIADWLTEESSHVGTVKDVDVERRSAGDRRAILTVYENGPDEKLEIHMTGTPAQKDSRMSIRLSVGKNLRAETTYSDEFPRIGVSVMNRAPEVAARDIDRRLLPDGIQLYNRLLFRLRRRRKRENRRESIAEKINANPPLTLTQSRKQGVYHSDRIFFERDEQASQQLPSRQIHVEPKLRLELRSRGDFTIELEKLNMEEALAVIRAAQEEIEGPIRQDPPRERD